MSGAPTTPGRRRREREEPYIPFNHDPKNFGTRTGVAMPKNVPRDSAGFEDASYFFPPLPPAPDSDDRVTTYSRRTPGTGKTMRTSVGPSTNGRPSTGMTSRRKRMSDLGGDEPDDTFAQGDANMLVDDDFADDDIRPPTAVPLPPSSRRADRTPGASKDTYADLPSPSVGSPSTRRSTAAQRQSKHGLSSRLSASASPQKRRSTTTAHSRLSAITANTTVDTDELGDALAIDESLVETEMIVGGEEDLEEGEGEDEEGSDAGAGEEVDVEEEDRSRAQAKAKGKGNARSTLSRREANEQDAEEQDEEDPSEEVPRKSRLSTKSTRSLANDESDGEGDRTRASLAPSLRLGDVSFGAADLETDEYGNDTMDDIGPSRHDHADDDGNEEGDADDDVNMEQDAMDEEGLDEIPEEQDEEQDDEGEEDEETLPVQKTAAKGRAATKAKTRPPRAKSRAQREESVATREKREAKRKRLSNFPNELDGNGWQGDFQTRRSGRQHIKPLEYWRGEKVEYGKGQHQAVIKEVVTIPQDPVVPLAARNKRGAGYRNGNRGRSKSRRGSSAPPIEEWDLETEQNGMVNNFITNEEEEKRIVFPSHMRKTKLVQTGEGGHFGYQKTFGDDFHASGYVEIQPGQEKPSKPSRDNAYTFCVLEGVANVCIHRTSFVVAKHGQFEVPRGNEYKITNIHTTPLLIFFSQSRKVRATSEEIAAHDAQIAASQAGAQAQSQSQRRESNAAASKKKSLPNGKATGKGKGKRAPDPDEQETEQEDDAEEGEEEEEEVVVPKKKVKSR